MKRIIPASRATATVTTASRRTVRAGRCAQPGDGERDGGAHAVTISRSDAVGELRPCDRPGLRRRDRVWRRPSRSRIPRGPRRSGRERACRCRNRGGRWARRRAGAPAAARGHARSRRAAARPRRDPPAGPVPSLRARRASGSPPARAASRCHSAPAESRRLAGGRRPGSRRRCSRSRRGWRSRFAALEDVGDRPRADAGASRAIEADELLPAPRHVTLGRGHEAAEDVEQGRLPRSGGTEQPHALAVGDLEIDVGESPHGGFPLAVHDADAPAADQRAPGDHSRGSSRPPSRRRSRRHGRTSPATCSEWVISSTADWYVSRSIAEGVEDDRLVLGIELARRLVGEHQSRTARGRRSDRDALLFTAGEPVGRVAGPSLQTEASRASRPPRRSGCGRGPPDAHEATTFSRAVSVGQRLSDWKTTATSLARMPRQLDLVEPREGATVEPHVPRRGNVHRRSEGQHRALSAARGTDDGHHLPRLHLQVRVPGARPSRRFPSGRS